MKRTVAAAPHLRRAGLIISLAGLLLIGLETLLPEPGAAGGSHFCLLCGYVGGVGSVLNVLLFVPLGVGLALTGSATKRSILAMCALSVLIETTQLLLIPGRYSTLGDVITNSVGGAIGFIIGRYALTLLRPPPRVALILTIAWSALWLGVQAISAFGFSPSIPASEYYGQVARRLGELEQFQGQVMRASIGDIPLTDDLFKANDEVRQLLARGAIVTATVIPSGPSRGLAPIVRVADTNLREVLLVAQNNRDLVFGVRTGASILRLRPPFFALRDVFPQVAPGAARTSSDELIIRARYSPHEVWLDSRSTAVNDRRIPLTASLGWTLFLPFQWLIEGTQAERAFSALWILCLVLPIGYWGVDLVRSAGSNDRMRNLVAVPVTLLLLWAGLVAIPVAYGIAAAPPRDWLSALAGLLSGGLLRLAPGQGMGRWLTALEYREGGLA